MSLLRKAKNQIIKAFWGKTVVPRGLFELQNYFLHYGPITFKFEENDGQTIAVSTDYKYGSIIATGKDEKDLDRNIKDAILTSFEVPSSFAKEAKIHKTEKQAYALA